MSKGKQINPLRLMAVTAGLVVFWLLLEAHLFQVQVLQHDLFWQAAQRQYTKRITIPAIRGVIFDRNGNKLVTNSLHYDLAADPEMVRDKNRLAAVCADALGQPKKYFLAKLNQNNRFQYLARKVPQQRVQEILKLDDRGVIKTENFRRRYPYKSYAAQVLGFTDTDDRGLSGIELQYDELLRGKDGEAVLQYDGPRKVFYNADTPIKPPVNGDNIYLTLDKNIQTVVEEALREGAERVRAKAGMVVVLDPNSGAVLAMANWPSFDPARQQKYAPQTKRNRCITDVIEPGSTMKIITAAALLQEQLKNANDIVFCENGSYRLFGRTFHDTKRHGWLTFQKVIEKSSNIGMIKLSGELKRNVLFRYLKNFGFGNETGIGLSGESAGMLRPPNKWSRISKASISIGYGIGVTVIQLAAAYAATVNGGFLYRPYLVSEIRNNWGDAVEQNRPQLVRQVLSKEVSAQLRAFMRKVVEEGTGKKAALKDIPVGGKTGTARKMDPNKHIYSNSRYVASFVGFAPYNRPKYVCAVIMDEPRKAHYGGEAAAPIFRKIMERIVHLNENAPLLQPSEEEFKMTDMMNDLPDIKGFSRASAVSLMQARNIEYEIEGQGDYVKRVLVKKNKIFIKTGALQVQNNRVPNLVGITLREAIARVDLSKFRVILKGRKKGVVTGQSPPPGAKVKKRTELILTCAP